MRIMPQVSFGDACHNASDRRWIFRSQLAQVKGIAVYILDMFRLICERSAKMIYSPCALAFLLRFCERKMWLSYQQYRVIEPFAVIMFISECETGMAN